MKNKKLIILPLLLLLMLFISGCSNIDKAQKVFDSYSEKWIQNDYSGMYQMLSNDSKTNISEEDFTTRYNNIFSAITANNLSLEITGDKEKVDDVITIPFKLNSHTIAGDVTLTDYKLALIKEDKEYKIKWDESLIFPQMTNGDKVRVNVVPSKRGSILDKDDNPLAKDGLLNTIGIYPAKFNLSNVDTKITEIANILDISEESIKTKLEQNTNPEYFVPLVSVLPSDSKIPNLSNKAEEGVLIHENTGRVYVNDEAFGRLIGYVGNITAEELEANKDKGYSDASLIGKAGLEQVYEETLRGKDFAEIYIERGSEKITIAKNEGEDGKDVKTSIDSSLQSKIYSEMNGEKGAATAVNPKTGELLAMVSAPSFNSNTFTTYVTKTQKSKWEETNNADEVNRFNKTYSPGSTMKLLTSSIGLQNKIIDPNATRDINGLSWQKDSSWGNFKITRVTDPGKAEYLKDAVNHSDNIYFGQVALELGSEKFINGIKGFGIGEELIFEYPMEESQISNDGSLNKEILLADTGYGQGEIMVTPLNVALAYSALANNGDIMQPRLIISKNSESKIWKQGSISKDNLPTLIDSFTALINDSGATISDGAVPGFRVAGKTGSAEIKKSQDDTNGTENGWFVSVDPDTSKISLAMIIEDVKGRGGSHVTVPKVRNVMEYYLTK
ncbi:penicillin-binding transpeptidase domain-containing protein [Clostridium sp.]|uniref:penicillin-binding transpeptidase domain-containing protein n=1 Tax=Clostridium sp. TaxID=1506 RepID=UPI0026346970|nr:penicillin-binding transpeptidase domain-containing protein [Clostridium sp.]